MALRAVVFGLEGVLIKDGQGDQSTGLASPRRDTIRRQISALFAYLRKNGIRPIVLSNRDWKVTRPGGATLSLDDYLQQTYGDHTLYVGSRNDLPLKPKRSCIEALLTKEGLDRKEVLMVGMSRLDFQTAINGKILFLNAIWDRKEIEYGFVFSSPTDVQRFVDLFARKAHPWFYAIDDPVTYRSLAPFSTLKEAYRSYSEAARAAAKQGTPQRHFFLNTLVASLYFSGIIDEVTYIACVPGHKTGYGNPAMNDVLTIAGQSWHKRYLPDLVLRHTDAPSQRAVRNSGQVPKPETQLNTIHLSRYPLKKGDVRYKSFSLSGKTVLLFDDFCTNGYSMEAARVFLEESGARVIAVSWLKTINRDYTVLTVAQHFNCYGPVTFLPGEVSRKALPYAKYITDGAAPGELTADFQRFTSWEKAGH